jgi:Tannase and feruloyl esterase
MRLKELVILALVDVRPPRRWRHAVPPTLIAAAIAALVAPSAEAAGLSPTTTCDAAGIGQAKLLSDLPTLPTSTPPNDTSATILSTSTANTSSGVPYCLVKVLVQPAINIWVGLPMGGNWNGRLQSEGGGGFAGSVAAPVNSVSTGYVGVQTDTGHNGGGGAFGMLTAVPDGAPNVQLQTDFAYRSEHEMAVIGKQLAQAFYGTLPQFSYWNGCSTGGRQGLRIAQQFPNDYNGILAGAPAIHFDRLGVGQMWPQLPPLLDTGGPISAAKQTLATNAAVSACDAKDGVVDGVLNDPRQCTYNPVTDASITRATCSASDNTCLTPAEAGAILKIWNGPTNAQGKQLWYGYQRGAALNSVAGAAPNSIPLQQAQYWIYFDPSWDYKTLNYSNFQAFFTKTMAMMNSLTGSESPDLSAFRDAGGKIVTWQGFADQLIMSQDSIDYYDSVTNFMGGGYAQTQQFFRHFMAPGVGHCGGGSGPQPQNQFQAVVDWVESGKAPQTLLATKALTGGATQSRPLCPYPASAKYIGTGSTDDAANFVCSTTP